MIENSCRQANPSPRIGEARGVNPANSSKTLSEMWPAGLTDAISAFLQAKTLILKTDTHLNITARGKIKALKDGVPNGGLVRKQKPAAFVQLQPNPK